MKEKKRVRGKAEKKEKNKTKKKGDKTNKKGIQIHERREKRRRK